MSPLLGPPEMTTPQASKSKRHWWQAWRREDGEPVAEKSLFLSAFLFLFLAGVFYLIKFYLESQAKFPGVDSQAFKLWSDIAQHISVAFLVACVSILGIEYNAKRRADRELKRVVQRFDDYRKQVSEDVFEAVLGLIIQGPLRAEIMAIFRIPFIKSECRYTFRFLPPRDGTPEGYCIVQRDLWFDVTNISEAPQEFPVRSSYASDEDLKAAQWGDRAFHLALTVRKPASLEPARSVPPEEFLKHGDRFTMEYPVPLAPGESAKIFLRSEEPRRIEANRSLYYQSTPVDAIEILIENNFAERIDAVEVHFYHPGKAQTSSDAPNQYTLRRAFLPGQSFDVVWKKTATAPAGKEATNV